MKIELNKTEMKIIENLLMEAALSATDYKMQGQLRGLKDYFSQSNIEHERYLQLKGN